MTVIADEDRDALRDGLRLILSRIWPAGEVASRLSDTARLTALWSELCANGIGTIDTAGELAMVASELGRASAPVPLIGAALARRLLARLPAADPLADDIASGAARIAVAFGPAAEERTEGSARFSDGHLTGRLSNVEDLGVATHLLVLLDDGNRAALIERAAIEPVETPGYAVPALSRVTLAGTSAAATVPTGGDAGADLVRLARLLLVARAAGAARRGLELAVDYVQVREQFGQAIGRFQALQHKLADCLVSLDVTDLMLGNAAAALDAGGGAFEVDALVAFASPALRRTMLELHHSFGAIGYAEEHELPRHFRRVHADLLRLGGAGRARLALGRTLLAGSALPALDTSERTMAIRTRIRDWLATHWTDTERQAARMRPFAERDSDIGFVARAGSDGWLAINWPAAQGGLDLSPPEQMAVIEETERAGAPLALSRAGSWLIAPALIRFGTDEQRAHFLPGIAAGQFRFCLGYSEPQAGSDLAALRTRAVRDGDDYVITGQKLWTTLAETATHVFLAVRTDPEARPKHAGISLFVVPLDSPGIRIHPGMALYGRSFSTVFYDDVRVPAANMVGPPNGGWQVLTSALASERVLMGGQVARMHKLLEELAVTLAPRAADPIVRDRVGALAADLHAARLLSLRSVELLERGVPALVEGGISKLFSGDLAERLGETALDLLGIEGTLSEDTAGAPLDGAIEQHLRFAIMAVIGGGTAEIQRTLIAQRGLGLPR